MPGQEREARREATEEEITGQAKEREIREEAGRGMPEQADIIMPWIKTARITGRAAKQTEI